MSFNRLKGCDVNKLRLGVNIDHVATMRNARGGLHPDPIRAALQCIKAGADSITAHLREDRRHIRDQDMWRLKEAIAVPLNFEMAATEEMQALALKIKPYACCIVPEKREERTTEGGLDVAGNPSFYRDFIAPLSEAGIRVSLFIDPIEAQVQAAQAIAAQVIELHTGKYSEVNGKLRKKEYTALCDAAKIATQIGLECHAGHGLNYDNVSDIAQISDIVELNIGHFLMSEAIFLGLDLAISTMRQLMDNARVKSAA